MSRQRNWGGALLCAVLIGLSAHAVAQEAVVTSAIVKSFEEAKAKAVSSVKDGDPVYLWIQFPGNLESYAALWTQYRSADYADRKALEICVGPRGDESTVYNQCFFIPTDQELKSKQVKINLAPGDDRPLAVDCWLKTVGDGSPGVWKNEIRIRTPEKSDYFAIVPLTADVSKGIHKYNEQNEAYAKKIELGDPNVNTVPNKAKFADPARRKQVMSFAAQNLGVSIEGCYWLDDSWMILKDDYGYEAHRAATGIVLYKKDGKNLYQHFELIVYPNGTSEINMFGETWVNNDEYAVGLRYGR